MLFKVVLIIHEIACSLKITEQFLRVVTTVILYIGISRFESGSSNGLLWLKLLVRFFKSLLADIQTQYCHLV
jgi:Na+-transporting methylmalonyl-CoA/oxaloacetate decarboxylase beta subunit